MKVIIKFFLACIALAMIMPLFCVDVFANDTVEEYRDFINSIPNEVKDNLPDGITSDSTEEIAYGVKEMSGVQYLLSAFSSTFFDGLSDALPYTCTILGLLIIASLLRVITASFFDNGGELISTVSRLCIFASVISGSMGCIEKINEYFNNLFSLALSYIPLSAALYSMGGNISAAVSSSATFSVVLTVCELIVTYTAIPVFCFCMCINLCAAFGSSSSLSAVGGIVKKNYIFLLSLIMAILCVSISAQTFISAKADNFTMRGAKFVIASFIPHFGGSVSQSLGNVASSVELMRSAVGIGGVIIVLLMLLPTVVEIAVIRLLYALSASVAGMLGCDSESSMLSEISSLYGYLLSVSAICSTVFLISFGLLAKCACAVG